MIAGAFLPIGIIVFLLLIAAFIHLKGQTNDLYEMLEYNSERIDDAVVESERQDEALRSLLDKYRSRIDGINARLFDTVESDAFRAILTSVHQKIDATSKRLAGVEGRTSALSSIVGSKAGYEYVDQNVTYLEEYAEQLTAPAWKRLVEFFRGE